MTRINVVPVEELTRQHLQSEYREITRVFGLARKAQRDILGLRKKLPPEYTLGTGHVLFFMNKLKYCSDRYAQLTQEMRCRGYSPNPVSKEDLISGIDSKLIQDYTPTLEAVAINRQRIRERLQK